MNDPRAPHDHRDDVARVVEVRPEPELLGAIGRGHDLASAVADIVDNSLDAGATTVRIRFGTEGGHLERIAISDNGRGMSEDALVDALTLGRRRQYAGGDLGHFGVGLKAASMSQAAQLTVTTRTRDGVARSARLLRAPMGGRFEVELLRPDVAVIFQRRDGLETASGTVIEWRMLDRTTRALSVNERRTWLWSEIQRLRDRLGVTFHRLIEADRVRIEVEVHDAVHGSGAPSVVRATNPFGFRVWGANDMPLQLIAQIEDGTSFGLECYVLPPSSKEPAAQPGGVNRKDAQGFYVYRNDRLLHSGGWLGLHLLADDLQLGRVVLDIDDQLLRHVVLNHEKRGVDLAPVATSAIAAAADGQGQSWVRFLEIARGAHNRARQREQAMTRFAAAGPGVPDAVAEIGKARNAVRDAILAIEWGEVSGEQLFDLDLARQRIIINESHQGELEDRGLVDLLQTSLYLLFEGHAGKERLAPHTAEFVRLQHDMLRAVVLPGRGTPAEAPTEASAHAPADAVASGTSLWEEERPIAGRSYDHIPAANADHVKDYLEALKKHPLLKAEEEVRLAQEIEAGLFAEERLAGLVDPEWQIRRDLIRVARQGQRARARFVTANLRLVVSIAKRYTGRGLDFMDLVQEGNLGLMRAIDKFEYRQGTKFSTYATWWIRQSITRALADSSRLIRLPVHAVEDLTTIRSAAAKLRIAGAEPTMAEIAEAAEVDEKKVTFLLNADRPVSSLDFPLDSSETSEQATLGDLLIDDGAPSGHDILESAELAGAIRDALIGLRDDRQAKVLALRFGIDGEPAQTLDQIGAQFGVTRERIRQLETKAMARLREQHLGGALADHLASPTHLVSPLAIDPPQFSGTHAAAPTSPERATRVQPASRPAVTRPERVTHAPSERVVHADASATLAESSSMGDSLQLAVSKSAHSIAVAYKKGASIAELAIAANMDSEEVVGVLTHVIWGVPLGADRPTVTPRLDFNDRARLHRLHRFGLSINRIAELLKRSPCTIAWSILESHPRPLVTPSRLEFARRLDSRP